MLRIYGWNMSSFTLALMCAGVVAPKPAAAQQISACLNPTGQLRLVGLGETCRSLETLVAWDAGATSAPTVVDANGVRVGIYLGGLTLITIGNDKFTANLGRSGFANFGYSFDYLTPDCTGQAYTFTSTDTLVQGAVVVSNMAMFADVDAPTVTINGDPMNPGRYWVNGSGMPGTPPMPGMPPPAPCVEVSVPFQQVLTPLKAVDVSRFVRPFRIK